MISVVNLLHHSCKRLVLAGFCFFLSLNCFSQILVLPNTKRKIQPMNIALMSFIAETLHVAKPALNLSCSVKIREIKQERKFSDGIRIVEMLEIIYKSSFLNTLEIKAYFPTGSSITREVKVSAFSGTVEEIQLESDDLANSRFVFQHNGLGEIVWMSFEDDLKTVPCRLKN